MERFHELLLDVWREACRHIEITESTTTIAGMLQQTLPLQCLVVRRLDVPHSSLESIAFGTPAGTHLSPPAAKTELSPPKLKRLLEWAKEGKVAHSQGARRISEIALV